MRPSLQKIHDSALRTGICVVWVGALLLGISEFLFANDCEYGSLVYTNYILRSIGCFIVAIIAICAHGYLVGEKVSKDD